MPEEKNKYVKFFKIIIFLEYENAYNSLVHALYFFFLIEKYCEFLYSKNEVINWALNVNT